MLDCSAHVSLLGMPIFAAAKAKVPAVQTNDLDDWENANIATPGTMKSVSTPKNQTYSIEQLKKMRESCNLDKLDSWPNYEIVNNTSTPRGRSSPRSGFI